MVPLLCSTSKKLYLLGMSILPASAYYIHTTKYIHVKYILHSCLVEMGNWPSVSVLVDVPVNRWMDGWMLYSVVISY